jgi:hypothetical protein
MTRPSPLPMTRREVAMLGAAACLASLAPMRVLAQMRGCCAVGVPMLAVADARYAASEVFAARLARQGATRFSLDSDAGGLWFAALEPRLGARAVRVAGLTLESDLFILRRLAASSAMSVCYMGRHDWRQVPHVRHVLRGGCTLDPIVDAFAAGAAPWPTRLADALAALPLGSPQASWQERRIAGDARQADGQPNFLVSWVIKSEEPPG